MKLKYNLGSPELSHLSSKELIAPRGLQGHHLRNRQPLLIPQRLLPPWLRERCFAWNGEAALALGGGGGWWGYKYVLNTKKKMIITFVNILVNLKILFS